MDFLALGQMAVASYVEFTKIAAVPRAVKMYRRAWEGLETAQRSAKHVGDRFVPQAGFALHDSQASGGLTALKNIVEDRKLLASKAGPSGQHGAGVYWWRGFPPADEDFFQHAGSEGILSDLESLPNKLRDRPNAKDEFDLLKLRTGPGDYSLRPKDYAVLDTATRTTEKGPNQLGYLKADMQESRLRPMDSAIFHRALKDFKSQNTLRFNKRRGLPTQNISPQSTNNQLIGVLKQRERGNPIM